MSEQIILVNERDEAIGVAEKLEAHQRALLHRAFSIFIFRKNNNQLELLLQKRHPEKYHCGGLWTNTCCGHPRPGELVVEAAARRLYEEVGIQVNLKEVGLFQYQATFDNRLTENEVDHVLVGFYLEDELHIDVQEIEAVQWLSVDHLKIEVREHPSDFTPWFKEAWTLVLSKIYHL